MTYSLAWLSPFSRGSDVSAFSQCVLSALSNPEICPDLACSLLVNDNGPRYWTDLPAAGLQSFAASPEILRIFDFVVYNLGNNQENHHLINTLAMKVPGVAVVHDLVISVPAGGGYGGPTLFFALQGVAVLVERSPLGRRVGLGRGWRGWLFTMLVLLAPGVRAQQHDRVGRELGIGPLDHPELGPAHSWHH